MSIPITKEVVEYISQYGGRCRDCADCGPICPNSGLPCITGSRHRAIQRVIEAYNYGTEHGFLKPAPVTANTGAE